MIEKLLEITHGFIHRFPEGNEPFQIMTRLLEESGELAQQINHFEGSGVKMQKYGEPDKVKLVNEIGGVLHSALQIAIYYEAEQELETRLEEIYLRLKAEGHIQTPDPNPDEEPA